MNELDPKDLLGQPESHRLEFKRAEILRQLPKVAREVVGFLNADGGEIWIGVKEAGGRAVELETIPDVDGEKDRLRDHLIATIEPPSLFSQDVDLEARDGLLHLTVRKGKNPPYAQRDGGRHYWIRAESRLRDMLREEIAEAFAPRHGTDQIETVKRDLLKAQAVVGAERPQMWLRLVPVPDLAINVENADIQKQLSEWLVDPAATGNRRGGAVFAHNWSQPRFRVEGVVHGLPDSGPAHRETKIKTNGEVTFFIDRDALCLRSVGQVTRDLSPFVLMELPISLFRLMSKLLRSFPGGPTQVIGGFAMSGIKGWRLQGGSPRGPTLPWFKAKEFAGDLLETDPGQLTFSREEIEQRPDRCGFRLIRLIYEGFGFETDAIPGEFDQLEGILRLG